MADVTHGALPLSRYATSINRTVGLPLTVLMLLFPVAVAVDPGRMKRRRLYLGVSLPLFVWCMAIYFAAVYRDHYIFYGCCLFSDVLLGIVFFLLTERKNYRLLAFLLYALLVGVFLDLSSDVTIGLGTAFGVIATGLLLRELLAECAKDTGKKRRAARNFTRVAAMLLIPAVLLQATVMLGTMSFLHTYLAGYRTNPPIRREDGPYRGISTSAALTEADLRVQTDLDRMKEMNTAHKPVYIADLMPRMYLYLDEPFGCCSAWFVGEVIETRDAAYWRLHPQKRPAYIYVPTERLSYDMSHISDEALMTSLGRMCDFEQIPGEGGTILRVTGWHLS